MPYPLVSVVIATLGDSALVMNALDSLKRQTFKNFDVIIVNQGPSLMKKMIKEYSDLTLHYSIMKLTPHVYHFPVIMPLRLLLVFGWHIWMMMHSIHLSF